jgi:hypothetical protein
MEPLHKLFKRAQEWGVLNKLSKGCDTFRVSLYADVAALFINLTEHDWSTTNHILNIFADASGLATNLSKTEFYPIRCEGTNLEFLSSANYGISTFPCKYLGVPLHYKKTTKAMMELLIQKIGDILLRWKRGFLSRLGRELLIKSMLTVIPTFFLIVFKMPKWAFSKID